MTADFLIAHAGDVGGEAPDDTLLNVRVQMRFQFPPIGVLASDDKPFPLSLFQIQTEAFTNVFEVLQGLVGNPALGMAAFVPFKPIIAGIAREHVNQRTPFAESIQSQVEETRSLSVHHGDTQRRLRSKKTGE